MIKAKSHSRGKFYLVILIFLIPMLGSWILYFFHEHFHFKTTNRGHLLMPPIQTSTLLPQTHQHQWQIIYMPEDGSTEISKKTLFTLTQLHKVLGKDYDRVKVVFITAVSEKKTKFVNENSFQHLSFASSQYQALEKAFKQKNSLNFTVNNKIYLVDPIGNLFMYYSSDANAMDILKDLKHLLGVSQIG